MGYDETLIFRPGVLVVPGGRKDWRLPEMIVACVYFRALPSKLFAPCSTANPPPRPPQQDLRRPLDLLVLGANQDAPPRQRPRLLRARGAGGSCQSSLGARGDAQGAQGVGARQRRRHASRRPGGEDLMGRVIRMAVLQDTLIQRPRMRTHICVFQKALQQPQAHLSLTSFCDTPLRRACLGVNEARLCSCTTAGCGKVAVSLWSKLLTPEKRGAITSSGYIHPRPSVRFPVMSSSQLWSTFVL